MMVSKSKSMIGIPRFAEQSFDWRGFRLEPGYIFGLSLDSEWFVFDHKMHNENDDYSVFVLDNNHVWKRRSIKRKTSLWSIIRAGEVELKRKKAKYGDILLQQCFVEKENTSDFVECDLHADCYHKVMLPKTLLAYCSIALKKASWRGFVLQRGHIFGLYEGEEWFVSGMERRRSDSSVAVYTTYNQVQWLKNWFDPKSQMARVVFEAVKQRNELGIYQVLIVPTNLIDLNVSYAKQDFATQSNTYHGVASGGMVRPK